MTHPKAGDTQRGLGQMIGVKDSLFEETAKES